jgi:hypothetical protein
MTDVSFVGLTDRVFYRVGYGRTFKHDSLLRFVLDFLLATVDLMWKRRRILNINFTLFEWFFGDIIGVVINH